MTQKDPVSIQVGDCLEEFRFGPISRAQLALYAGASGDHNPIHIDTDFAKASGLSDVFAHGMLSFGVLTQVVTRWCGIKRLRSFGARFLSITQVHDEISCRAKITERFEEEGEVRLRIEVTATTGDGRQTLSGEAIVGVS